MKRQRSAAVSVPLALVLLVACGSDPPATSNGVDAGGAATDCESQRLPAPLRPGASCAVTIDTPPCAAGSHVPEGTVIAYGSNPPANGEHYPVWAQFKEYDKPVARPYLVHSMEHGAVVLLYRCDNGPTPCPAVIEALRTVRDGVATDPLCDASTRVRVIIAPDPELDVAVAAAAWNWTYKADCVDVPSLQAFAKDHYAKGPENFCTPGRSF